MENEFLSAFICVYQRLSRFFGAGCGTLAPMRTDTYIKAVLTVIAFLLLLIACNQYINPESKARAEGPFAGLQFSVTPTTIHLFDTRTGEIWVYNDEWNNDPSNGHLRRKYRLTKPGQPLVVELAPK
jgi:disulfide bond formation protein DsbB